MGRQRDVGLLPPTGCTRELRLVERRRDESLGIFSSKMQVKVPAPGSGTGCGQCGSIKGSSSPQRESSFRHAQASDRVGPIFSIAIGSFFSRAVRINL